MKLPSEDRRMHRKAEFIDDLAVSLGAGSAMARAYGCDLTKGYIDENAAYYSS